VQLKIKNTKFTLLVKTLIGLLLLSSIVLIVNQPAWFHRELHKNNFVMLTLTKKTPEMCVDTGCENIMEEHTIMESSASGVVFKKGKDRNYVLTAEHFCNAKVQFEDSLPENFFNNIIQVQDISGEVWDTQLIYYDPSYDLCLLATDKKITKEIKFAKSMPEIGEKVFAISAPMGLYAKNVSLHFEGLFSGCDVNKMCFFSIPAVGGSSGSLVYNKDGKVISMIQMAVVNFHSLSMGVDISQIRNFLETASEETGIELL